MEDHRARIEFTVSIEKPLARRKYEKRWNIPQDVIRICVKHGEHAGPLFAGIFAGIQPLVTVALVECSELYTPRQKKWSGILDREIVAVEGGVHALAGLEEGKAYALTSSGLVFVEQDLSKLQSYMDSLVPF